MIKPRLHAAPPNMNCAATALWAITGKFKEDIERLIRQTSGDSSWTASPEKTAHPSDWIKALEELGYKTKKVDTELIPIEQFMSKKGISDDAILVSSCDTAGKHPDHVFATQGKSYVDCCTHGEIREFKKVSDELKDFKVKYLVELWLP